MRWHIVSLAELDACPRALDTLESVGEVTHLAPTEKNIREMLPQADAYFATLKLPVERDLLTRCPRLRLIATPSTGLDHVDVAAAADLGVEVLSLRGETAFLDSITATAELTWALLLAAARRLPAAVAAASDGQWARDRFRGHQLSGKTLGILGMGRLGRIVANYGLAFRMTVLACDRPGTTMPDGVRAVDFDTLLREADALSLHIHLNEENRNLLDKTALQKMKKGAILVNTSRGAIIDEAALVAALQSGHLLAAAVDVIHGEWDANLRRHPLIAHARTHDNLIITPHIGGITHESQRDVYQFMAKKLLHRIHALDAHAGTVE